MDGDKNNLLMKQLPQLKQMPESMDDSGGTSDGKKTVLLLIQPPILRPIGQSDGPSESSNIQPNLTNQVNDGTNLLVLKFPPTLKPCPKDANSQDVLMIEPQVIEDRPEIDLASFMDTDSEIIPPDDVTDIPQDDPNLEEPDFVIQDDPVENPKTPPEELMDTNILVWKEGVGTLPYSELKFKMSENGELEMIDDEEEEEKVRKEWREKNPAPIKSVPVAQVVPQDNKMMLCHEFMPEDDRISTMAICKFCSKEGPFSSFIRAGKFCSQDCASKSSSQLRKLCELTNCLDLNGANCALLCSAERECKRKPQIISRN